MALRAAAQLEQFELAEFLYHGFDCAKLIEAPLNLAKMCFECKKYRPISGRIWLHSKKYLIISLGHC
jgi:hypothetical protein